MREDPVASLIFVAIALAFAVTAWRRPSLAVCGLVLIEPFALYHYIGPTTMTLPKAAIVGFVVGLALRRPALGVFRSRTVMFTGLAAITLVLMTAVSCVQAEFKWPAMRETLKAFEYLVIFALCAVAIANDPDDAPFRNAALAIASLVALLAIAQEFTGGTSALWLVAGHRSLVRVAGPLEGPNQLAGYLGLLLPVVIAYLLRGRLHPSAWLLVAVIVAADCLTFSRAGVASAVVAILIVLGVGGTRSRAAWLTALGLPLLSGAVAVTLVGGRLSRFWSTAAQLQPEGLGTRRQLWTAAYRLWRAHPVLGIGADNYEFELSRVGFPELRTHPNGQFIQALVEGGFPLLAALLWATLQPLWSLWHSGSRHPAVIGAIGALTGLALHQLVDSMTFFPKVGMLVWIIAGVSLATAAREPHSANA